MAADMTSSIEQSERRREAVLQQLAVAETDHQTALRVEKKERQQEVDRLTADKVHIHILCLYNACLVYNER